MRLLLRLRKPLPLNKRNRSCLMADLGADFPVRHFFALLYCAAGNQAMIF